MLDWSRIKVFSKKPTIWDILFKLLKNRDLGQLNAYVGYYKKNEMAEGDRYAVSVSSNAELRQ